MIKLYKGKVKQEFLPVTPSTTLSKDELVAFDSGKLVAADSADDAEDIVGVLKREISSDDDDYADDRLVPVEVPLDKNTEYRCDVASGLVSGDIGKHVDLSDAGTIDRGSSSKKVAQVKKVLSSTEGIFKLNINEAR